MPDVAAGLSYRGAARLSLDPRTALLGLVVVNVICLSAGFTGANLWARAVVSVLPVLLLVAQRRWIAALVCVTATALALGTESFGVDAVTRLAPAGTSRVLAVGLLVVGALLNLIARFMPGVLMGWYVITTTRVGELMGALGRLHVPRPLVISLAVVLRMVPVLASESAAISQAARTRGLRVGLARPKAIVDYRVVPLTLRTVEIGDELTQAAFTRGLEATGPRTCYGRIGFRWGDAVALAICAAAVALFVMGS